MNAFMQDQPATESRQSLRLLCAEDRAQDVELIALALDRADPSRRYQITRVDDAAAFAAALDDGLDAILCDYHMPRFSPAQALAILAEQRSPVPLVVVTHSIGEEAAVRMLRDGARDYVTKDRLGTLLQVIERVVQQRRMAEREVRLQRELTAAYQRLKGLSARAVAAQERERAVIARELHDVLGQTLTAVVFQLHAARKADDRGMTEGYIDSAVQLAHEAIEEIRTLSFALRPAQLDALGFVPAVESALREMAEPAGLQVRFATRGTPGAETDERAPVMLRLAQEAVTNTVRHANATRFSARLAFRPNGRIVLVAGDNGSGFDAARVLSGPRSEANIGLTGMIERTELLGGQLRFRTRPSGGVIIRAIL